MQPEIDERELRSTPDAEVSLISAESGMTAFCRMVQSCEEGLACWDGFSFLCIAIQDTIPYFLRD